MKTKFIFLFLFFLIRVNAQTNQTPLFGTMWYLTKIEESEITYHTPPYNGFEEWLFRIAHDSIVGVPTGSDSVTAEYCYGFTAPINVENNTFNFIDNQFAITLNMCPWLTTDELNLMNRQTAFYENNLSNSFEHQINEMGSDAELIITNIWGNKAFYSTIPTATASTEIHYLEENIKIYPNPSSEKIFISLPNDVTIRSIKIFNLNMQQVADGVEDVIDVSNFAKGTYIIGVEINNHKIYRKIIVK